MIKFNELKEAKVVENIDDNVYNSIKIEVTFSLKVPVPKDFDPTDKVALWNHIMRRIFNYADSNDGSELLSNVNRNMVAVEGS